MSDTPLPGVELAPLPREQVGPFLVLGVPKDADSETVEAHWAQRVLWARQGKSRIPLEDIHWARQMLRDPERRLPADAASLNPDTTGNDLRRLARGLPRLPGRAGAPSSGTGPTGSRGMDTTALLDHKVSRHSPRAGPRRRAASPGTRRRRDDQRY